ncbi:Pre-mRNA-processing protein PRP40 domain-containing protein [Rozella allomycis CSF55]|uniref:Pre-mRNA-processing protein PRP40 domain-containing protein n=1 Tax=Rozella allomycis (strain CSF55) TaxID=988480 RepID=A0A075APN9_ROZAC|nr:Pre-mRNA-processing protein PRP40 domain-containing protein [Rozella allomycis CSF55]|eukprot:EPZ32081.1 Pre-mRNA-processing protein PRP40 domain-containing protein [Rozella allomycis CSF55]
MTKEMGQTNNSAGEYKSREEAMSAFMEMLAEADIEPYYTWEETMRLVINHPNYKALPTPKERKDAFTRFMRDRKRYENEARRNKMARWRRAFEELLLNTPEITPWTRYAKAREILKNEKVFNEISDDRERENFYNHLMGDRKMQQQMETRNHRRERTRHFHMFLKDVVEIKYGTTFDQAHKIIKEHPKYKENQMLMEMDNLDLLISFEEYYRKLERDYNRSLEEEAMKRRRAERINRDNFKLLLKELEEKELIHPKAKWKNVFPCIKDDERFLNMLGQPGSTPMDLFFDRIEELDELLYKQRKIVQEVLSENKIDLKADSSFEWFLNTLAGDERTIEISKKYAELIFNKLIDKIKYEKEDEERRYEKRQRRAMRALRSVLKRLEPPISSSASWDQVRPRIEKYQEYQDIDGEENRIKAFKKFISRLRAYEEENEEGEVIDEERDRRRGRYQGRHERDYSNERNARSYKNYSRERQKSRGRRSYSSESE